MKYLVGSAVLVAVLCVAASEEWSWGKNDKLAPAKGSQRSPRLHSPESSEEKFVFKDTDVRGRNPRVDLGARVRPTVSALHRPASHSIHTIDTPGESFRVSQSQSTGGVDLYVPKSHGSINVPISVNVETTERNERKYDSVAPADSEGRFLGIGKRLCKMGIGHDCYKYKYKVKGKANVINLDHVPYLPSPIHPPHYSPHAHPGVPYGGIDQSDVFHVQPVALQPVGSPIQAIPLGPSGGKVPHHGGLVPHHGGLPPHHGGLPPNPYGGGGIKPHSPYSVPTHPQNHIQPTPVHHQPISKEDNTIVQHIHKHTHIYQDGTPVSSQYHGNNRPSRAQGSTSSAHQNSLYNTHGYSDDCECVAATYCAAYDVVHRNGRESLLDARNNKDVQIYSNHTATEDEATTKASRKKRDTDDRVIVKRQTNTFAKITNSAKKESRGFGYSPGRDGCYRGDVCCRSPGRIGNHGPSLSSCGRRHNAGVVGRVKTPYNEPGDTDFGEYPWQGAILRRDETDMVYVCGATLISDHHVVTAAHCVNKLRSQDVQVRLGEWDVANDDEFYPHIDSGVQEIIVHQDYYAGMLHNDIAILKLDRYVDFVNYPHISPICLPDRYDRFEGQKCHVTGWGKDAFGTTGNFQKILKKVEVPVVRKSACENVLQDTRLGRNFRLHDGMTCAGGEEGKDACKGDGGGPLVCKGRGGDYMLAGLVSWGIGCGERGLPGVYVDIPYYSEWINQNARV